MPAVNHTSISNKIATEFWIIFERAEKKLNRWYDIIILEI